MSATAVAGGASGNTTLRRLAEGALLLGSALTLLAPFLPIYVTYPYCAPPIPYPNNCAPRYDIPAQDLLNTIIGVIQAPENRLSTVLPMVLLVVIFAFVLCGIPIILSALSVRALVARRRAPSWRAGAPFLVLVVIGAALALLELVVYVGLASWDYGSKHTFTYGVGVTFLGYLLVLLGSILLMTSAGSPAGSRRARRFAGSALLLSFALPLAENFLLLLLLESIGPVPVPRIFPYYPWLGLWLLSVGKNGWLLGLLFLGAPITLAILGTVTLCARSWIPGQRALVFGRACVALGAASAVIGIGADIFPHLFAALGIDTRGAGASAPLIAAIQGIPIFLGYLLALVGVIWLPRISRPAQAG